MAGYLGKISAVVSVNNSDVKPKLDASAQEVSKFARTVEGNLRSASSSAAKAFDGIYTPLQRMERAMYAASTMKLSFKGFEGAFRDVDGLRTRLASLSRQRINLDVTGSGFRSIEEMRKAIGSITSKDVKFISDNGGLQKIRAENLVGAMDDAEKAILAKFDRLNSLDQIKIAIDVVGQASLDAATQKMRQMAMAAEAVAKPLSQASSIAANFSLTIQQNLSPAMARAQAAAESLRVSMGNPGGGNSRFANEARQARELLAVIKQVAEAQSSVSGMKTGRELAFANPRLAAQLSSAAALGNKAAEMPASFLSGNSNVARLVQQLNAVSQKATEAFAAVRGSTSGVGRAAATAELAKAQAALDSLIARLSKELPLDVDTTSAVRKIDELEGHIGKFSRRVTVLPPNFFRDRVAEMDRKRDETLEAAAGKASRRATILPPNYLPDKARENDAKRFEKMFGSALGSASQQSDAMVSKVRSLQSAIAELPAPLQSKLIPALERAKQAAFALGTAPTTAAIAKASQEAEDLEAGLKRAQAAAKFSGTFASFLDDTAADRYVAQLNTIRKSLMAVGATASGPVASAIDAYQRALYEAGEAGTLGTEATKKQMDSLLQKIAQVGFQTEKQRTAFVQMVQSSGRGDVGRMGADKANLALQQAAFAVDDFMSSTGGVEHRIRAISNNLTQMAFILGSTKGLWLAVGATMATTIAIPILKAIFQFEDMESRLKALNGELEKSQNIAERTAESYKELAKALREAGVGGAAGKTSQFVDERRREARERAESIVMASNEEYVRRASRVQALQAKLEKEPDIGERARLQREITQNRREMEAIRQGGIAPSPMQDVAAVIEAGRKAEMSGLRANSMTIWDALIGGNSFDRLRAAADRGQASPKNSDEALRAVDEQIAGLQATLANMPVADFIARNFPRFTYAGGTEGYEEKARKAREALSRLEEERAKLEQDAALRRNDRFMSRAMAAAAAAELTPQAMERVGRLGLDGDVTAKFEKDLSAISSHFGDVIVELEKAVREGRDTRALEAEADKAAQALEYLYQAADRYASAVALGAVVPTQQRLERAGEQLSGVGASNVATAIAQAQARRAEVEEKLSRAQARGDGIGAAAAELELEQIRNHTARLEAASVATAAFQRALEDAAGALSTTLVQEAQSREQELRRGMNRGVTGAEDSYGEARREADRQEARDRQLRIDMNRERLDFEQSFASDPELTALANRVRDGRDLAGNRTKSAAEQEAGRLDAEAAQAELDRRFENRPEVVALRQRADAADAEVARRNEEIARANEQRQRAMGGIESASQSGVSGSRDAASLSASLALGREAKELQRKMEDAVSLGVETASFDAPMKELRRKLEAQATSNLRDAIFFEQTRSSSTEGQLESARDNIAGIEATSLRGAITAIEVSIRDMERRRDEAIREGTPEGDERAAAIQQDIDAQREHAAEINAASVAVGAFQEAMVRAALALQESLVSETTGRANDARRQANEAAAVFGEGSPEARRAAARQQRAEQAMRDAEDEKRRAEEAINAERVKVEKEIADGDNPAAADRARRIAELEATAKDETKTASEQAAARAEAERLKAEQQREFEARPEVKAERDRADKADREMQRRLSAERGREMMMSEEQKRREDIRRQAGDLGNAVKEMKAAGEGRNVPAGVREAAMNMARDAAPLYAQLTEEVMNARLQGPSRAALNVSDISTSQGAAELNRLIRGEDSAKDVNLAELKKQSNLLEAIEKAVKDSTGVVVTL